MMGAGIAPRTKCTRIVDENDSMNNPTKATRIEDWAKMVENRRRLENLSFDDRKREQLDNLRRFIRQLEATSQGRLDLENRTRILGPCDPDPSDNVPTYYGRLRRWLDIDLAFYSRS